MQEPPVQCTVWEIPAAKRISKTAQIWREARHLLIYIWHALRGPMVPPARAMLEGDKRTIILVPGFLGRGETFVPMQRRLNAAGHPCYILPLGFQMGDILKKGRELTDLINRHKLDDVYVIAHSMGGLVTISSMLQGEKRIRHLWCLGSPLFGTVNVPILYAIATVILLLGIPTGYGPWMIAAGIFMIPCLRQMSRESVLLRWLRSQYASLENVTAVFATYDEIVLSSPMNEPGSTSRLGRSSDVYFPEIGHNNLFQGETAIDAMMTAVADKESSRNK